MESHSKDVSPDLNDLNKPQINERKKCLKVADELVQKPEFGILARLYVLSKWAVTILSKADRIWQKKQTKNPTNFILSAIESLPEEFYARQ